MCVYVFFFYFLFFYYYTVSWYLLSLAYLKPDTRTVGKKQVVGKMSSEEGLFGLESDIWNSGFYLGFGLNEMIPHPIVVFLALLAEATASLIPSP